jgi:hypothetical protein
VTSSGNRNPAHRLFLASWSPRRSFVKNLLLARLYALQIAGIALVGPDALLARKVLSRCRLEPLLPGA